MILIGEIALKNLTPAENLNHFYEQGCSWTLHSNVERQLELDISSKQNRKFNSRERFARGLRCSL